MDILKEVLTAQGFPVDIEKDVAALKALVEIRENWSQLTGGQTPPDAAAVIGFINKLLDESTPLKELGKDGARLRSALQDAADLFHKIDPKYFALTAPVASFDEDASTKDIGRVQWKVLGVDKSVAPKDAKANSDTDGANYAIDLGAQATLTFEAGDTWPDQAPNVPDPLLRIGFTGGLKVSGKASAPLSLGKVEIGGELARDASLDYYFDARGDEGRYGTAVIERLGDLPNPWDLESVMKAMNASDFFGAVFETTGRSSFTVGVSVADPMALTSGVNLAASLTFDAKVTRSGTYHLKLRKVVAPGDAARALEVTIERSQEKTSDTGLALGIDVDLAALGRKLADILSQHQSDLSDVIAKYKDYLTPGTYLKNGAKELLDKFVDGAVKDKDLHDAVAAALSQAAGLTPPDHDAALRKFIEDKASDAFDAAFGVITGAADDVVKQLAEDFMARTGLPVTTLDDLSDKLRSLLDDLRGDFDKRLDAALDKPLEKLDKTGKKNKKKVDDAVEELDGAGASVKDAIGRYELGLKKLKDAVSDAARMKVTAKITAESSSKLETSVDAKLTFARPSDQAKQIYRDVVRGDFDAILRILGTNQPDVSVDASATALETFSSAGRKVGYALVLLGFEFGGGTTFDMSSKVLVEGNGKVSVLSENTWKRRASTPRESREISFVNSYELLAAKDSQDFSISLALSHQDEVLKRNEVEELIGSFEKAGLVPRHTTEQALVVFRDWFGSGEKGNVVGDLNFSLRLEDKEMLNLLCLGERAGDVISPGGRRRIFGIVLDEMVQAGEHTLEHLKHLADVVLSQSKGKDATAGLVDILFAYTPQAHQKLLAASSLSPDFNSFTLDALGRAKALNVVCMSFVEMIDRMGDVFTASPSAQPQPGFWTVQDYNAAQKDIDGYLGGWLDTGSRLFWIEAGVRPRTIAFIGSVAALAGMALSNQGSIMTLTMTRRSEQPPVTVTLS